MPHTPLIPVFGKDEIPDVPAKAPEPLAPELKDKLEKQVLDDLEIAKALEVRTGGPALKKLAERPAPGTPAYTTFLDQVQKNAIEFESEGEAANGLVFENTVGPAVGAAAGTYMSTDTAKKELVKEKATDTQGQIANADEDGVVDFDEGGANVATKDTGTGEKLYDGETIGNWAADDEDPDDAGPVGRAQAGQESEFDDDATQVPKDLLDDDSDDDGH